LLSRQGRITTSLFFSQFNYQSVSEDLDAEPTTVKSIVSSKLPDVLLNENMRMHSSQWRIYANGAHGKV